MVSRNGNNNSLMESEKLLEEKIGKLLTDLKLPEDKREQICHSVSLYLRSQMLTELYGIEKEKFKTLMKYILQERKVAKLFFIDILGAHAWANPLFHKYLYEQIRAYVERNRTNIWNLELQHSPLDVLLRKKIEERLAQHIDIDEVLPDYDSGAPIDLEVVRILSWSDDDMKTDVAQDLINLHRVFNIPLLYVPENILQWALNESTEKLEFHLSLDKNDKPFPSLREACWIYKQGETRRPLTKKAMKPEDPKDVIEFILQSEFCLFAAEKRKQLLNEEIPKIRILAINSPTIDMGGFKGSPTSLLYALNPLIEAIKAKKIKIVGFSQLNIFDLDSETAANSSKLERELRSKLSEIDPHIVMISTTSLTLHSAESMAKIIKEKANRIVIIGGPHCDEVDFHLNEPNPNNPLNSPSSVFDFVISGDGEYMLLKLVQMIIERMRQLRTPEKHANLNEDIRNYVYRNGRKLETVKGMATVHFKANNEERAFQSICDKSNWLDLNKLKPLRYEYLKKKHLYDFRIFQDTKKQTEKCVQVMTHRGCGGSCNFCSESVPLHGIRSYYNYKEAGAIINELQHYVDKLGVKAVFFDDSTFMEREKDVRDLCERMKDSGLSTLNWGCLNRFDKVKDRELIDTMTRAGLNYMYLGLESIDDRVLKLMNKSVGSNVLNSDLIEKTLQTLKECGVRVGISILFGHPDASEKDEMETIEWVGKKVKEKKIMLVSLSLFNHHEASLLSEYRKKTLGLNYFKVEENIKKQNKSPWNCFEEGGWFHSPQREVDEDYLARLLWKVKQAFPVIKNKEILVRIKELEGFIESDCADALKHEQAAFEFIQKIENEALSKYTVVGDYLVHDEGKHYNFARDLHKEILDDLKRLRSDPTPSFYLVWGETRSGKTFLLGEIGKDAERKGYLYKPLSLADYRMNQNAFVKKLDDLEKRSRKNPTLVFIDEIASKSQLDHTFTPLLKLVENIKNKSLKITLVMAGSYGKNVDDLKEYLESPEQEKNQGKDLIGRVEVGLKKYSMPDLTIQDRIIVALGCIMQACKTRQKEIRSVEKSALYSIVFRPTLKRPGPIKDSVLNAVKKASGKRITYNSFFDSNKEKEEFENTLRDKLGNKVNLQSLHGKFARVWS